MKKQIMKKGFITFSIIFSLIFSINFARTITTDTGYTVYFPELPFFLENVSPFSLGSITDPELLFEFGLYLAAKAKAVQAHSCVIGYSQLLPEEGDIEKGHFDEKIAPFFSSNPFKASQTIEWIANGLTAGGIFPALSAKYGLNDSLILYLNDRMIYPAILLESYNGDAQTFEELGLAIIDDSGLVPYYSSCLQRPDWKWEQPLKEPEQLRRELLIASIVRIKKRFSLKDFEVFHTSLNSAITDRSAVFVKDPRIIDMNKFSTGYLIHTIEDFMLERIRLICSEIYHARGSKNW